MLTVILLFYYTWTKRTKNTLYTHTHTHIYEHTYRTGALRLEESLSLALFCYLVTLPEAVVNPANNRDLFGLLAFSLV